MKQKETCGWWCSTMSHPHWDRTFTPCSGSGLEWVTRWERLMERLAVTEGRWKSEIKYSSTAEPQTVRSFSGSTPVGSPRESLASLALSEQGLRNNMASVHVKNNVKMPSRRHRSLLSWLLVIYCTLTWQKICSTALPCLFSSAFFSKRTMSNDLIPTCTLEIVLVKKI